MTVQAEPATAARPGLVLAVLAVGGSAFAILQSLVVPALPALQRDLGASPTGVAWIFTTYLLAASVATPIAGRLGDMFGKKRMLVLALVALSRRHPRRSARDDPPGAHRRARDPGPRRRLLPARLRDHP